MSFFGLTVQQLGLLGAGLGAVVIVLYILKLRRRRVEVPFAPLWDRVLREKETTTLFKRLRRILSLLVQLCLLALLILALGDPRPKVGERKGRDLALVIDTSASMQAMDVPGGRLEKARE